MGGLLVTAQDEFQAKMEDAAKRYPDLDKKTLEVERGAPSAKMLRRALEKRVVRSFP